MIKILNSPRTGQCRTISILPLVPAIWRQHSLFVDRCSLVARFSYLFRKTMRVRSVNLYNLFPPSDFGFPDARGKQRKEEVLVVSHQVNKEFFKRIVDNYKVIFLRINKSYLYVINQFGNFTFTFREVFSTHHQAICYTKNMQNLMKYFTSC